MQRCVDDSEPAWRGQLFCWHRFTGETAPVTQPPPALRVGPTPKSDDFGQQRNQKRNRQLLSLLMDEGSSAAVR